MGCYKFNLHLIRDIHAVTATNYPLAAAMNNDRHMFLTEADKRGAIVVKDLSESGSPLVSTDSQLQQFWFTFLTHICTPGINIQGGQSVSAGAYQNIDSNRSYISGVTTTSLHALSMPPSKSQPVGVLHAHGRSKVVTSLCWQRSKPVFVDERNCIDETALVGGSVEDSILMPDPYTLYTTDISVVNLNYDLYGSHHVYIDLRNGGKPYAHGVLLLSSSGMDVFSNEYEDEFRKHVKNMSWLAVSFDANLHRKLMNRYRIDRILSLCFEKVIERIKDYGQNCVVFSRNKSHARDIASHIHCGVATVNDFASNYMCQSLLFGGVKQSGFGYFGGVEGLQACCLVKSVLKDTWWSFIKRKTPKHIQYHVAENGFIFKESLVEALYELSIWDPKIILEP